MSETVVSESSDAGAENASADTTQLPEWAREKLTKANAEAAKYRTERNEAQASLDAALGLETKLSEESAAHASTKEALEANTLRLLKLEAAIAAEIPHSKTVTFADMLKGASAEELASNAQELKAFFGTGSARTSAVDPTPAMKSQDIALNDESGLLSALRAAGAID